MSALEDMRASEEENDLVRGVAAAEGQPISSADRVNSSQSTSKPISSTEILSLIFVFFAFCIVRIYPHLPRIFCNYSNACRID